ncbi:hypothetical protein L798_09556 [Zootermopsis nevadensis]|uniref:Secreted protein n=1 Tax=Zootermopsis nevadensis TaxID=136037 RepID=A0A067R9W4_ZOONE|nr:hypothetical protein L798_09556 [Zootermopsis nevadensis]
MFTFTVILLVTLNISGSHCCVMQVLNELCSVFRMMYGLATTRQKRKGSRSVRALRGNRGTCWRTAKFSCES